MSYIGRHLTNKQNLNKLRQAQIPMLSWPNKYTCPSHREDLDKQTNKIKTSQGKANFWADLIITPVTGMDLTSPSTCLFVCLFICWSSNNYTGRDWTSPSTWLGGTRRSWRSWAPLSAGANSFFHLYSSFLAFVCLVICLFVWWDLRMIAGRCFFFFVFVCLFVAFVVLV